MSFNTINKLICPSGSHSLTQNWPKTPHPSADKATAGLKTVFVPNLVPRSIKPWSPLGSTIPRHILDLVTAQGRNVHQGRQTAG